MTHPPTTPWPGGQQPPNPAPQPFPQYAGAPQPQQYGGPPQQPPYPAVAQGDLPPLAPRKRSRVPLVIVGVVVLALVAGGAAVALMLTRGGAMSAVKGLPVDTVAVLEVDLEPAASDLLALKGIADKLPMETVGGGSVSSSAVEVDYKQVLYDLVAQDDLDYETDIKPWLGDSVAVALVDARGASGVSELIAAPVVAVDTTDRARAEEFAREHVAPDFGHFFVDDVLVMTPPDSTLTEEQVRRGSLADDPTYKADMAKMDGMLARAWYAPRAIELGIAEADGNGTLASVPAGEVNRLRGSHGSFGLRVAEDLVALDMRITAQVESPVGDVRSLAGGLSADSLGMAAVSIGNGVAGDVWRQLADAGMESMLVDVGITSAGDLDALLGEQVAFSVDYRGNEPVVGAKLVSDDTSRQQRILRRLESAMNQGEELLEVEQEDRTSIVAFNQYVDDVADPQRSLADLDSFKRIVDGPAQAVVFVNVDTLSGLPAFRDALAYSGGEQATEWVDAIDAAGVIGNVEGSTSVGSLRVLVR